MKLSPSLLIGLSVVTTANAHIFFQFPEPRSCFYGGFWGADGDGPWRREPCDREPGEPTATFRAGSATCLSLHEFVPHPATYDITLLYGAIGPGDSLSTVDTAILGEDIPDPGPADQTGYQRFMVTIPKEKTCDKCTIQVKQYAEDFDWYYYACVDVRIVSALDGISQIDEGLPSEQCVWEPADGRIRANILRGILINSALVIDILFTLIWFLWVYFCQGNINSEKDEVDPNQDDIKEIHQTRSDEEEPLEAAAGGENKEPEAPSDNNNQLMVEVEKSGCFANFMRRARSPKAKRFGFVILSWAILSAIGVAISMVGLKACWFGPE